MGVWRTGERRGLQPILSSVWNSAQIALIDADAWALGGFVPPGVDAGKLGAEGMERLFDHFEARQRQIAAVLGAHGLEVTFAHCPVGKDARAILRG
jgi:hypothetical protein